MRRIAARACALLAVAARLGAQPEMRLPPCPAAGLGGCEAAAPWSFTEAATVFER